MLDTCRKQQRRYTSMRAKKNRAKAVHIDARKKEQSKGGTSMGAERNKGDTQTCLQKGTEQRQYTSMLAERNRAMAVHIDACRKEQSKGDTQTCLQKGAEQRRYTSMRAERNRAMAVHIDACRKQEIGYESNTPGTW